MCLQAHTHHSSDRLEACSALSIPGIGYCALGSKALHSTTLGVESLFRDRLEGKSMSEFWPTLALAVYWVLSPMLWGGYPQRRLGNLAFHRKAAVL